MAAKNGVVTKSYLDKRLVIFGRRLKEDITESVTKSLTISLTKNVTDAVTKKTIDEMRQIQTEIMGELRAMRENDEVHQFSHERINIELEEHEDRLRKIEQVAR